MRLAKIIPTMHCFGGRRKGESNHSGFGGLGFGLETRECVACCDRPTAILINQEVDLLHLPTSCLQTFPDSSTFVLTFSLNKNVISGNDATMWAYPPPRKKAPNPPPSLSSAIFWNGTGQLNSTHVIFLMSLLMVLLIQYFFHVRYRKKECLART